MPKRSAQFVDWKDDWRNCRAKKQLIKDLNEGQIPLVQTEMTAEVVHKLRPLYEEVDFPKFKRNFEALRKAMREEKDRAVRDSEGFARDKLHQGAAVRSGLDRRSGKLQWNNSEAQRLLSIDVQQQAHAQLTPRQLHESRPEYKAFDSTTFRNHIYAEERRQKRTAKYERERNQAHERNSDEEL
jgi:hypothetical protein